MAAGELRGRQSTLTPRMTAGEPRGRPLTTTPCLAAGEPQGQSLTPTPRLRLLEKYVALLEGNSLASFWESIFILVTGSRRLRHSEHKVHNQPAASRQPRHHRWLSASVETPSWCDVCGDLVWGKCVSCLQCVDCRYKCHRNCKVLISDMLCQGVHTGPDNNRLPSLGETLQTEHHQDIDDCDSGYSGSGACSLQRPSSSSSSTASTLGRGGADDEDASAAALALSREETCRRIQQYNLKCGFAQFITLPNKDNVFQGNVQVCLSVSRPVSMSLSPHPTLLHEALKRRGSGSKEETATAATTTPVRLPKNAVVSLHVSSTDTVTIVIEMLLKKFKIMDSPHRFALYEQTLVSDADVKLRRLTSSELPLVNYLRWRTDASISNAASVATSNSGTSDIVKRLVLQEDNSGEIVWEAFSIPELLNFLRILDREERDYAEEIKAKHAVRRRRLQEARLTKERSEASAVATTTMQLNGRKQKKR